MSSPETLWVGATHGICLYGLEHNHRSTVLGISDLPRSSRFLQPERYLLNNPGTNQWSITFRKINGFSFFGWVMVQFVHVNNIFLNFTTLHIHACCFQINQRVKRRATGQRKNYPDTIDNNGYLPGKESYRSRYMQTENVYQNTAKRLSHSCILKVMKLIYQNIWIRIIAIIVSQKTKKKK